MNIHIDRAIAEVGGVGKLAATLGVVQSAVSNWKARGNIPPEHCASIEAATKGIVTRRDLRPSDWQKIWPELAPAQFNGYQHAAETAANGQ